MNAKVRAQLMELDNEWKGKLGIMPSLRDLVRMRRLEKMYDRIQGDSCGNTGCLLSYNAEEHTIFGRYPVMLIMDGQEVQVSLREDGEGDCLVFNREAEVVELHVIGDSRCEPQTMCDSAAFNYDW